MVYIIYFDNEFIFLIAQWKLPVITGNRPPPCAYFTIHTVPGNKGVMFGGIDIGTRRTNDLHIFTIDNTIIVSYYFCLNIIITPVESNHKY